MLIVGEKINTSRKGVGPAVKERNRDFIQELAKEQVDNGADYVDINCGTLIHEEPEALVWLVRTVQEAVDAPLCIDSPNPAAIESALREHRGKALVNSITAEKERYDKILPLIKEYNSSVVALCIDDEHGMPKDKETRCIIAKNLVSKMIEDGIPIGNIHIDPLIEPVSTNQGAGLMALETISYITKEFPGVHAICGLSNVSFGLPNRMLLNQTFLVMAMIMGLDGAILDPGNRKMMALLRAAEVLLNKDDFCANYLTAYRNGNLVF